ncbi:MAG: hypothetical protein ABI811_00025, partial [Acidobacteriota bacterium]
MFTGQSLSKPKSLAMVFEHMAYCHGPKTKSKTSARALHGARASVQKTVPRKHCGDAPQRPALAVGHCTPPKCACGALVSSLEVLQSMEVSLLAKPHLLCPFRYTFSFLFLRIERIRSSPLEKLSPKSFSND